MSFTIHRADAGDPFELLDAYTSNTPANSSTKVYDEDGVTVLATIDVSDSTYLKDLPANWRDKIKGPDDTLIGSDQRDLYLYDAGTASGFSFDSGTRQQILTNNDKILHSIAFGDGNDVINLTRLANAGAPAAYAFDMSAWGGGGNDWIATADGADYLQGEAGSDTLWGGGNNDTLFGGAGIDRVFGGTGADTVVGDVDALAADGDYIVGWEGGDYAVPITVALSAGDQVLMDFVDGGFDFDTDTLLMQMPEGTPGARNVLTLSGNGAFQPHIFGIEVIAASAAADIINLSWYEGGSGFGYEQAVTVLAGDGNDVVFAGDGSDTIYGDATGGVSGFSDTLFGGRGDDTIFADPELGGPGAADTVFGGFGNDTVFGGAGDDVLIDAFDGNAFGGLGDDLVAIHFSQRYSAIIDGGIDDTSAGTDGNDRVFVSGVYDMVQSQLGAGNDLYVAYADESSEVGQGDRIDIVYGGTGNDVIATWYGDDVIDGGDDSDALWGGDGADTIYGGAGTDYLYTDTGDNDYAYGGEGIDYYYWAVYDGNDQIYDEYRDTELSGQAINALVVYSGFDESGQFIPGQGVFESDGNVMDYQPGNYDDPDNPMPSDDKVWVYDVDGDGPGTIWQLQVVDENSFYYGTYVEFDQRDVSNIILWNSDATGSTPAITQYVWDGVGAYTLA